MKSVIKLGAIAFGIFIAPFSAPSAGAEYPLDQVEIDHGDKASLQRGARTFVNYCMGCHSASYHRYSRLASDLGLTEQLVEDNLIFTTDAQGEATKVGSLMENAMADDYAKKVFGTVPPNLALISRSNGADMLYTYMRTFYHQPGRSGIGANNMVFPDVAMPHVLWELQGWREAVFTTFVDGDGNEQQVFVEFKQITDGQLSSDEYDALVRDLVNFLDYLGDPIKSERHIIGFWVMGFLFIFFVATLLLKKEYWKDIH